MSKTNLLETAGSFPKAWSSRVIGRAANANVKVLRMDSGAYPDESHDFDEALLVLDGRMNLLIQGGQVEVTAGGQTFDVPFVVGIPRNQ